MIINVLEVINLRKSYGEREALKGISFNLQKGELFSLLGPNGAGKTTTLRILAGLTTPSSGEIKIFGKSLNGNHLWAKTKIGLVPQQINLDLELSCEENLLIHGLLFKMEFSAIRKKTDELLELAGLKDRKKSRVKELSGGLRRRLLIIRALLHSPEILLLDEPTVGLDPSIRRKIWSFIKQIQGQGTTILLTTHYMEEAEVLSDRVAFISQGKIIEIDTPVNFIKGLGEVALDVFSEKGLITYYFKDKKTAESGFLQYSERNNFVSMRKITLEDVFVKLTEKEGI
ncbi:ABC transporter [Caldimicrobium thiodismutans]|uniref:ABC transporter n=1 Tax=Caldimicrobium thiodismutans TaxID=1653476 RepID=A0A0U5AMJ0_9BACT|nr:ABC transporter ATP-binding protein [Caldimicrobium thiodismutans]BAU23042.1 ABC transporter [Caldimicrobium thiodismutans]